MTKDEALRLALEALENASNAIESWGSYASEYFQDKHDLQVDINNTKQAITAIKAALLSRSDGEAKDEPVQNQLMALIDENQRLRAELKFNTTPPQRKPLTDEEIERIYNRYGGEMINCARAIERAHGIKGEA